MSKLTINDYKKILTFYNKPIPKSKQMLKQHTELLLADKLCRCIKKIEPVYGPRSIGICTKTIFNNKGLTKSGFKCKGIPSVTIKKYKNNNKNKTNKTNKTNKNYRNKSRRNKSYRNKTTA